MIDTSIWVDVEQGRLKPADVAAVTELEPVFLSPVTLGELEFGAQRASDPGLKQKRLVALGKLRRRPVIVIDDITGEGLR